MSAQSLTPRQLPSNDLITCLDLYFQLCEINKHYSWYDAKFIKTIGQQDITGYFDVFLKSFALLTLPNDLELFMVSQTSDGFKFFFKIRA